MRKKMILLFCLNSLLLFSCNKQKSENDCTNKTNTVNSTILPYQEGQTINYTSNKGGIISLNTVKVGSSGYVYPNTTVCVISKNSTFTNDSMSLIMSYNSGYPGQPDRIISNVRLGGFDFGYDFDILQISDSNPQGIVAPPTSYGNVINQYLGDTTINGKTYKYVYATTVQIDSIYSSRKFMKFYLNSANGLIGMIEKNNNTKWFLK